MSAIAIEGTKTCHGSCHCGAVKYEVDIDFSKGTSRCNCTWCTKHGWWSAIVKPEAFRLISGGDATESFGTLPVVEHLLCRTCKVEAYGHGNTEWMGGEYYSINLRCLDDVDLTGVPVKYLDGRHDTWAVLGVRPWANPFAG